MIEIQLQMSSRAIELLVLPENTPCYILDIGLDILIDLSPLDHQLTLYL